MTRKFTLWPKKLRLYDMNNRQTSKQLIIFTALALAALALSPAAWADPPDQCSQATLNGAYMSEQRGSLIGLPYTQVNRIVSAAARPAATAKPTGRIGPELIVGLQLIATTGRIPLPSCSAGHPGRSRIFAGYVLLFCAVEDDRDSTASGRRQPSRRWR